MDKIPNKLNDYTKNRYFTLLVCNRSYVITMITEYKKKFNLPNELRKKKKHNHTILMESSGSIPKVEIFEIIKYEA